MIMALYFIEYYGFALTIIYNRPKTVIYVTVFPHNISLISSLHRVLRDAVAERPVFFFHFNQRDDDVGGSNRAGLGNR